MNCIVDIGNTRTKIAWFENTDLIEVKTLEEKGDISDAIQSKEHHFAIISSVADQDLTKIVISNLIEPIVLDSTTPIPIKNKYRTPDTLGKDRLSNAVAACLLFNESNTLVIDAGTCLKYDFINSRNEYIGGSISPGLKMRFEALHTFTDKLPLVSPEQSEPIDIGVDTLTSIHAGCYKGMNNEIMTTINTYMEKYGELKIILTGGDMEELQKMEFSQKNSIFADRWLTLRGLNEILRHNA